MRSLLPLLLLSLLINTACSQDSQQKASMPTQTQTKPNSESTITEESTVTEKATTAQTTSAPKQAEAVTKAKSVATSQGKGLSKLNQPIPVAIERGEGRAQLMRGGKPYLVKGAGGSASLEELAAIGGNSTRTWGVDDSTKALLDRAHAAGISVTVGFWLGHERHGFNYSDAGAVKRQHDEVIRRVKELRNHPAVLCWALGNEMEGFDATTNPKVWQAVEALAKDVQAIDENHPVITVIAGAVDHKVDSLMRYCPSLDAVGVNNYGGAASTGDALRTMGWDRPYLITEFGPMGHWEVPKTDWGAALEPDSQKKAANYFSNWRIAIEDQPLCLGGYVFVWGQKQEATATWYGMFLKDGRKLAPVDAMAKAWSGQWPKNRCPKLKALASDVAGKRIGAGEQFTASVDVSDPNGDKLQFEWTLYEDILERGMGGDAEREPDPLPSQLLSGKGPKATFKAPSKSGPYRVFVIVHDGKGAAATANFPIYVN